MQVMPTYCLQEQPRNDIMCWKRVMKFAYHGKRLFQLNHMYMYNQVVQAKSVIPD